MAKQKEKREFRFDGWCTSCRLYFATESKESVFYLCPKCKSGITWNDHRELKSLKGA